MSIEDKAMQKALHAYAAVSEDGAVNLGGMQDALEAYEAAEETHQPVECREEFEAWILPRLGGKSLLVNELGWYEDVAYVRVEDQWEVWKAAWGQSCKK